MYLSYECDGGMDMQKKKVMILGAAEGQMPIVNICKRKGYYTIVVSTQGNYPCFNLADKSYYIDTRDKEKILSIAQQEGIDAILTDQTDVSVPSVAYVAEKMNLRGIGYETSLLFTNKYLMRAAAEKANIAIPKFGKAKNLNEAKELAHTIGYPVMVKPTDSSGSRGVVKVKSDSELIKNFELAMHYSTTDYIVIEEFIEGIEYLADGFAMDGRYTTLDIGIKEYFDVDSIFVSKMCMFSSVALIDDRIEKKVAETNQKLVEGLGLTFGITHAEYLYCPKDDKVYLVEIAARGGGVFLSSHITPTATGFNTNEALVDYVVEGKMTFPDFSCLEKRVSAWVCFSFPDGEIVKIDGIDKVKAIDGVYGIVMDDIYLGKKTKHLQDDSGKYGPILVKGNSKKECYKIIDKVKSTLIIQIRTEKGIEDLIW